MTNFADSVIGKLISGKGVERAVGGSKVAQTLEQFAFVHESWNHQPLRARPQL